MRGFKGKTGVYICLISTIFLLTTYCIYVHRATKTSGKISSKKIRNEKFAFLYKNQWQKEYNSEQNLNQVYLFDDGPRWRNIGHSDYKLFVYAAYILKQGLDTIRNQVVIISSPLSTYPSYPVLYCQLHYKNNFESQIPTKVLGKVVDIIREGRVCPQIITCELPASLGDPLAVSVLFNDQTESSVRLNIKYQFLPEYDTLESDKSYPNQFSVCLMPTQDRIKVLHFLEWFEFYKLMGVEQITVYSSNIDSQLDCVLNNLQSYPQGISLSIVHWVSNASTSSEGPYLWKSGVHESHTDCIFRHKGTSKYLATVNIHEFIMPRVDAGFYDYADLMEYLEDFWSNRRRKYGAFIFQKGIYQTKKPVEQFLEEPCSSITKKSFEYMICTNLQMMRYVQRSDFQEWPFPPKYVFRPDRVHLGGYNLNQKLEKGYFAYNVSDKLAFSRQYEKQESSELPTTTLTDRVARDIGVKLAMNVARSIEYFTKKCNLSSSQLQY